MTSAAIAWSAATLVAVASCAACETARTHAGPHLVETARIALAESTDDPIAGTGRIHERPGGGFILADMQTARVRLFDAAGAVDGVLGGPGEGPGELRQPTDAIELADHRVLAVQRADPRLTIFTPGAEPRVRAVPGQYGFLLERAGSRVLAGVATEGARYAILGPDDDRAAPFGVMDPAVSETPYWIWFVRSHATVANGIVAINTSFFPRVRLFDLRGDSTGGFPLEPADWSAATAPPVSDLSQPGNRERIEQWARSFTVVRSLATVGDSLLVVEYGRHDPSDADPWRVVPTSVDVHRMDGTRIASGIELPGPVVGGGRRLLVLVAEPPDPWTVAVFEWEG